MRARFLTRPYEKPRRGLAFGAGIALAAAVSAWGCGSTSTSGASPSAPQAGDATITITSSGASPKSVTVKPGSRVLFVNQDSIVHQMYSDPHPEHTDCPEFDQVGSLGPGQSRLTGNLNTTRTCAFHDHLYFENVSLRGSVLIQ